MFLLLVAVLSPWRLVQLDTGLPIRGAVSSLLVVASSLVGLGVSGLDLKC